MLNLIRAEWFKLSRRPMAWVLLAVFLALLVLMLGTEFMVVVLHDRLLTGGNAQPSLLPLQESQVDQFRRQLIFPGIFGAVLNHVNGVGGICAIVLAAGAMGSEYNWGTLRTQIARQPRRGRYLVAKIAALLLILLFGIAVAALAGALMALVFGRVLGNLGVVSAGCCARCT
jgi:ABC-2 type transport system permease protein